MFDIIEQLQAALKSVGHYNSLIRSIVVTGSASVKSGEFTKEELCDAGFLCREIVSKLEETRKDIGAMKVLIDKIACINVMNEILAGSTKDDVIRGNLSSGKTHFRKTVTLPKKDTEEFYEMAKFFGVTDAGIEAGVVKISWKAVCKFVTELSEMGKPIPDFIPKIHDDYTVIHRRKTT